MLNLLSTARSRILTELRVRPHTISELSKITGYSKATVSYHLNRLSDGGYVKRIERGKWVYYSLTKRGLSALKYELAKMGFLLLSGLASLIYGILSLSERSVETTRYVKEIPRQPEIYQNIIPYLTILIGFVLIAIFVKLKFGNVSFKSQGR